MFSRISGGRVLQVEDHCCKQDIIITMTALVAEWLLLVDPYSDRSSISCNQCMRHSVDALCLHVSQSHGSRHRCHYTERWLLMKVNTAPDFSFCKDLQHHISNRASSYNMNFYSKGAWIKSHPRRWKFCFVVFFGPFGQLSVNYIDYTVIDLSQILSIQHSPAVNSMDTDS
jgi:hypothetical protein